MIDYNDLMKWISEELIDDDEEEFPVYSEREDPAKDEEKELRKRIPASFYFATFEARSSLIVKGRLNPQHGPLNYRRGHCYISTSQREIKMLADIALEHQSEMSSIYIYKINGKLLSPNRFTKITREYEDAQYKGPIPAKAISGYTELYNTSGGDKYTI